MNQHNLFISFVIAGRNDNYGGNFLYRMQIFVDSLLELWQKYNLDAELVIVEWNPPQDRPRLKDAVVWSKYLKQGVVRIIEVPSSSHYKFLNSDKIPMFEFIAKNVGILRAKGDYILITNPDVLFNEPLIAFLSLRKLRNDCFYRIDRYDVAKLIPCGLSIEQQLKFCAQHVFSVATINDTIIVGDLYYYLRRIMRHFRSNLRRMIPVPVDDTFLLSPPLHINAAGDFFLMAKQYWHKLRGYPELSSRSFTDGYICFLAASLGLRQVVLKNPLRIYHQKHSRLEYPQHPSADYQQLLSSGKRMLGAGKPEIINDENWGCGNVQLSEYLVK